MDDLVSGAKNVGISLSDKDQAAFSTMLTELKAWNAHTNLTGIKEDTDIIKKHFIDSLSVVQAIPKSTQNLIDIGTGAGFPGLVIAIVRPDIHITLLESVGKKVDYLNHIIQKLQLTNVVALNARAEDIAHTPEYREHFDVAVSRAVAELRTLVEYALPLLKVKGILIAQKNAGTEELDAALSAIKILGASVTNQIPISIPTLTERQLIVITKNTATLPEYPRRSGQPTKKPL
jgi:16S rRNA (guanine527-N7)-methyltransferase